MDNRSDRRQIQGDGYIKWPIVPMWFECCLVPTLRRYKMAHCGKIECPYCHKVINDPYYWQIRSPEYISFYGLDNKSPLDDNPDYWNNSNSGGTDQWGGSGPDCSSMGLATPIIICNLKRRTRMDELREKIAVGMYNTVRKTQWARWYPDAMDKEWYKLADQILALPEIKDGLTLRKLLQDNQMEDFIRWIKEVEDAKRI
jgi:hypothetical protein